MLNALRGYFWIILAAIVVWRLFPIIRKRLEKDDVSFEFAGQKLNLTSASAQVERELNDVRNQIIALRERIEAAAEGGPQVPTVGALEAEPSAFTPSAWRTSILWVDDHPENNAFLIQSLREEHADVLTVLSTDEALAKLKANAAAFNVVISDMARDEKGGPRSLAGVDLIERMREAELLLPVIIYASSSAAAHSGARALEAGAFAVTSSPTELLRLLRTGARTAFEAEVAEILRERLGAVAVPIRKSVDFVAERRGERTGIEIKNWPETPSTQDAERVIRQLEDVRERMRFDRILLVTRPGVQLPVGVETPSWLALVSRDELEGSIEDRA